MKHNIPSLIVYKASAGSGKTFTLATEYMKLLIQNPQDYKSILAVTFTNKATEEMKLRILSQLYGIWKQLPDSQSYVDVMVRDLGVTEDYMRRQAGIALHLLLHNYGHFRVETIDSFFQSVLRNLARELNLSANLHLLVNPEVVEDEAVDGMIESLRSQDEILKWILHYIEGNISEDKSWNVIGRIKAFGRTIFKDFYKKAEPKFTSDMMSNAYFQAYIKTMRGLMDSAAKHMADIAGEYRKVLNDNGLCDKDIANGEKGVAGLFIKLEKGIFDASIENERVKKCLNDAEAWATKKSNRRAEIVSLARTTLIPLLEKALSDRPRIWRQYMSARLTLAHLSELRLLKSIEAKVREMNSETNRFMLSDTQHLLNGLIDEKDSPFIYEKTGSQLKHIMIDEFQDTSNVQWDNFFVLLLECMSTNGTNIIVGDVKQSIYRWRDSDWRLLNEIDTKFPHHKSQIAIKTLDRNYRSLPNIVSFNNAFFTNAAQREYDAQRGSGSAGEANSDNNIAQQLRTAYADVRQDCPEGKSGGGYVSVRLLPAADYERATLDAVCNSIAELLGKGAMPSDICILVRSNSNIPPLARHLMEQMPDVRVVSDQAFRLDASIAVGIMVGAMRIVADKSDHVTLAMLAKAYGSMVNGRDLGDIHNLLAGKDARLAEGVFMDLLPIEFASQLDNLRTKPLYSLAEDIYRMFELNRLSDQSAYVCAFFDQIGTFSEENSTDIHAFLQRWENEISGKTIQADEVDGLRIMSIHKSKGLEFDNVIVPYCDWQIEKYNDNIMWCDPAEEPYNRLPLVPIDYSSKLVGTIYEDAYRTERLQNAVDNLNLLYVAFTRASRNLFVIGRRGKGNQRSTIIEECLPDVQMHEDLAGSKLDNPADKDMPIEFSFGSIDVRQTTKAKSTDNKFLQPPRIMGLDIETYKGHQEFRQSNKSRDFIECDEDEPRTNYVKMGSVLHGIFSTIATIDDIDGALRQLETEGVIYDNDITAAELTAMLRSRLSDDRVRDWFSGRWRLYNECTLLHVNEATGQVERHRPDRVMIDGHRVVVVDFKFGRPRDEHRQQVRQYMELLSQMGHEHVSGYLWYVYSNEIQQL